MQIIDSKTVGDQYTDAATIQDVLQSNGGYFLISNNDCYMEMQYNIQGQLSWTKEIHVPTGSGQIYPGTCGVRFRNFIAGASALLSAAISESKEPAISIGSSGVATPNSLSTLITGSVSSAGAIVSGSGFTIVKGAAGVYTINFTTPFSITPIVIANTTQGGTVWASIVPTSASSVVIQTGNDVGALADRAFNFVAFAVQ